MPDMLARVHTVDFGVNEVADVLYAGDVFAGQGRNIGPIQWSVNIARSAAPGAVKTAIRTAIEAAVVAYGITISGGDQLSVVGGPN
jgi:hypothetical protein